MALVVAAIVLTSGVSAAEVDLDADLRQLPVGVELACEVLDTGTPLRGIGEATGCMAGTTSEVRLVAICQVSDAVRRSPGAYGPFGDGRFTTQPCAFGVREVFFEVDGRPSGPIA